MLCSLSDGLWSALASLRRAWSCPADLSHVPRMQAALFLRSRPDFLATMLAW